MLVSKMRKQSLSNTDAVILCGGLGTRLRSVIPDIPKVLAPIGKETCLDILTKQLFTSGIRRIILATGYLGEQVQAHVEKTPLYKKGTVLFSREEKPLGTGGALKRALVLVKSKHFLLANGDTLFKFSLDGLVRFHQTKNADMILAVSPRLGEDSGGIVLDESCRITDFLERGSIEKAPLMSDGVYLINVATIVKQMPRRKIFSLEMDVLPEFIKNNKCFGFYAESGCFDIGTPKRYGKAKKVFVENENNVVGNE